MEIKYGPISDVALHDAEAHHSAEDIDVYRMAQEIRIARALRLSPEERLSLLDVQASIEDEWDGDQQTTIRALALLSKLLAASEGE